MKKIISVFKVIFIATTIAMLCSCKLIKPKKQKITPIYEGMSIEKVKNDVSKLSGSMNRINIFNFDGLNKDDNYDHFHDKDFEHEKSKDQKIEKDIDEMKTLEVIGDEETKYYIEPNEDFIIAVHIYNPSKFEIQSFTLNGNKYANYMFEEGSDLETLYLKIDAIELSGYKEFTIDAIKYIDGESIKDVKLDGEKTIKVGIKCTVEPIVDVKEEIGCNSIKLNLTLNDTHNIIGENPVNVYLSDGSKIIDEKPLVVGNNEIIFENLEHDKLYQYAVHAVYDLIDGNNKQLHTLVKSEITTYRGIQFDNVSSSTNSIDFSYEQLCQDCQLISISLLDNEYNTLKTITEITEKEFSNILSNTTYKLKLDYVCKKENKEVLNSDIININTKENVVPTYKISEIIISKTSIIYDDVEDDLNNLGRVTKVGLYKDDTLIEERVNLENRIFNNLLTNTRYLLKIIYEYDLNDGTGKQEITIEKEIQTESNTKPTISINELTSTENSIQYSIFEEDIDEIGNIKKIELYKGDELIEEKTNLDDRTFNNLTSYTEYLLKVTYEYDLNDGSGIKYIQVSSKIVTKPEISLESCNVINTSIVSEGETIYLQLNINKPSEVSVSSIIINGEQFCLIKSTTSSKIIIEILNNGQFESGIVELKVEKVLVNLSDGIYEKEIAENNTTKVSIMGELKVNDFYITDEHFNKTNWGRMDSILYLVLDLNNEINYNIDSLIIRYSEDSEEIQFNNVLKNENGLYYIEFEKITGFSNIHLLGLEYSIESFSNTLVISPMKTVCHILDNNETKHINTVEDLKNMSDGYYYILENDIDLKNEEWLGYEFNGVLNGNGHIIKNFSTVKTISGEEINIGLFSKATGVIDGLNIENATYYVTFNGTDPTYNLVRIGAIVGKGEDLIITNCSVDEASTINCTFKSQYSLMGQVGGIAGRIRNSVIDKCINNASITSNGSTMVNMGGICGKFEHSKIINCLNNGSITCNVNNEFAGGIAGWGNSRIQNCLNTGLISGETTSCAGISAIMDGDRDSYAEGCINVGKILTTGKQGGIVSSVGNGKNVNCYTNVVYSQDQEKNPEYGCSTDNLNSKSFYVDLLGWDQSIWELENLDANNEIYPTLKR